MKISFDLPPMWEYINARFKVAGQRVIFTFGDTIYNPARINITKELHAHEQIHCDRQLATPTGPAGWWAAYIYDPRFILAEEIPAHQAEFQAYCKRHRGAGSQRLMRIAIANKLCSKLYGRLVTHDQAMRAIVGEWEPPAEVSPARLSDTTFMQALS